MCVFTFTCNYFPIVRCPWTWTPLWREINARRWTECNGTSNSNMPVISRGDALMRDATGRDETGGEGEREETAHRGACCVSSRAKDESLMRSQPRDYPAGSRGRLYVCYRWARVPWVATCRRNVITHRGRERIIMNSPTALRTAGTDLHLIASRSFCLFCDINFAECTQFGAHRITISFSFYYRRRSREL